MFANDLVINPQTFGGANVATTYSLVGWKGDSASIRRDSVTAATAPNVLTISHLEQKRNGLPTHQAMVRVDRTYTDVLLGPVVLSSWLVISIPKGTTIITEAAVKDVVGTVLAVEQASGAIAKLINSEP
jgi:hypothetical protein